MQGAETTNVHPGLRIQAHEQGPLRSVCLAVDRPKVDPSLGRKRLERAETELHIRSYAKRHMRLYADKVFGSAAQKLRSTRSVAVVASRSCRVDFQCFAGSALNAQLPHESLHPFVAHPDALAGQHGMDAPRAVCAGGADRYTNVG